MPSRTPLLLAGLALAALFTAFVVPAAGQPEWPVFAAHKTGCLPQARTVRHAGGTSLGAGRYQPCLVDTGLASGEPGLAISRDGTLLRSVVPHPTAIAISDDMGAHWRLRPLPKGARDGIPDGYIDPVTDRYFYSGLGNSPVYSSDDKGLTWQVGSFDSAQRYDWNKVFSGRPVALRPAGYPTNIYYCNMTEPGGFFTGTRCFKSTDGGRRFITSGRDPFKRGDCRDYTQPQGSGAGRGLVDPRDGTLFMTVHFCGNFELVTSHDEGSTWTRRLIAKDPDSGGTALINALSSRAWRHQLLNGRKNIVPAEMSANQSSDTLALDGAGRLYTLWSDEAGLPVLAWSANRGHTWSQPVRITPAGVVQAVLPSLTVAADGRIGVSYYGTTDKQVWTGFMAISADGTRPQPEFETAAVTPPGAPLMPEPCCWASGPQEYTAARWAPDGSLWAAFAATTAKGDARGIMGHLVPVGGKRGQ